MEFTLSNNIQLPLFPNTIDVTFDKFNNPESAADPGEINTGALANSAYVTMITLLPTSKSIKIYEYYDGVHLSINEVDFLLTTQEEEQYLVYGLTQEYFSNNLSALTNLETFSYTSRFPSETNYSSFTHAPPQLKIFQFSTTTGLNQHFMQNATQLHFEQFDANDHALIPHNLEKLTINTLSVETPANLESFLEKLRNTDSFLQLTIEELDCDIDDVQNMLGRYLPDKWSYL